jgi:hypothetical protein
MAHRPGTAVPDCENFGVSVLESDGGWCTLARKGVGFDLGAELHSSVFMGGVFLTLHLTRS